MKEKQSSGHMMQFSGAKDNILILEEKYRDIEKICEYIKALEKLQEHQPREDQRTEVMETEACKL